MTGGFLVMAGGLFKLKDIMGASGGATSALLALADPQQSSRRGGESSRST